MSHRMTTQELFAVAVHWLLGISSKSWMAPQLSETACPSISVRLPQHGLIDSDFAVVFDEAQFPEFVHDEHEEIDP
jgi:hypothetical protein